MRVSKRAVRRVVRRAFTQRSALRIPVQAPAAAARCARLMDGRGSGGDEAMASDAGAAAPDATAARVAAASTLLATWAAPSPLSASAGAPRALRFGDTDDAGSPGAAGATASVPPPRLFARPVEAPALRTPAGGRPALGDASFQFAAPPPSWFAPSVAVTPLARPLPSPAAALVRAALSGGREAEPPAGGTTSSSSAFPASHTNVPFAAAFDAAAARAALLGGDPCWPAERAFASAFAAAFERLPSDPSAFESALRAAPARFAQAARACAAAARDAAAVAQHAHRGGGAAPALLADAAALEAEASTWELLDVLHGAASDAQRAHAAADAACAAAAPLGGSLAARLRCAARGNTSDGDDDVARAAAALGAALDRGGGGARFGAGDASWRNTRKALSAGTVSGGARLRASASDDVGDVLTRELDPDAPCRTGRMLHPADSEDTTRLCSALLALLRAGRLPAARDLAAFAGQPWRAAALGAGSRAFGPAAVGLAARLEADEEWADTPAAAAQRADSYAAELAGGEGGDAAARAAWKAACAAAAEASSNAAQAAPWAVPDGAVFGVLAADARHVMPACRGDWEASAWALLRCSLDLKVDDVVAAQDVTGLGAAATAPATPGGSGPDATLTWPSAAVRNAVPGDVAGILAALASSSDVAVAREAASLPRRLQAALLLSRWGDLADALVAWSGVDDVAQQPPPPGSLRAAAHLLLWLALLAPREAGLAPGGPRADDVARVLRTYVVQLAAHAAALADGTSAGTMVPHHGANLSANPDFGARFELVPLYTRGLEPPWRRAATTATLWAALAGQPGGLRARVLRDAARHLGVEGDGGVRSVVARALAAARDEAGCSAGDVTFAPRVRALEWAALGAPATSAEAATAAASLCRDLGLAAAGDGDPEAASAARSFARDVLSQVVPPAGWAAGGADVAEELRAWAAAFDALDAAARWAVLANGALAAGHPLSDATSSEPGRSAADAALRLALAALRADAPAGQGWLQADTLRCADDVAGGLACAAAGPDDFSYGPGGAARLALLLRCADVARESASEVAAALEQSVQKACAEARTARAAAGAPPLPPLQALAVRAVPSAAREAVLLLEVASQSRAVAVAAACAALRHGQPQRLSALRCDGDCGATVRALCRAALLPKLLLSAASAERALTRATSAALHAAADPEQRLAALCDATQLRQLLATSRDAALDAHEADAARNSAQHGRF